MKSGAMVFKIYKNGNKYNFPWYFLSLVQLLIVSRHRLHCIWPTILLKKIAFCFHLSIHLKIDKHSFKLLMSCYCQKWKYFFFFLLIITVQFVVSGVTQTGSSPIFSSGTYNYWPNRTVDGNFSQSHQACLHTAIIDVSEAWLRVDLQAVRSVKFVKFWYRNDSMCDI